MNNRVFELHDGCQREAAVCPVVMDPWSAHAGVSPEKWIPSILPLCNRQILDDLDFSKFEEIVCEILFQTTVNLICKLI